MWTKLSNHLFNFLQSTKGILYVRQYRFGWEFLAFYNVAGYGFLVWLRTGTSALCMLLSSLSTLLLIEDTWKNLMVAGLLNLLPTNLLLPKVRCNNQSPFHQQYSFPQQQNMSVILIVFNFASEDGILHNLSEYIAMSGADSLSTMDPDTIGAAISQKLGVVVSHTQLEELFTKLPWHANVIFIVFFVWESM